MDEPLGMKTQVTNRGLFNMDRTSGLGLTYAQDHDSLSALLLIKHSWLNLYLPLLARADFVTSIVAMGTGGNLKFGRTLWPEILPFDSSTVSALRTCLSAMPPEDCNDVATIFLSKGVEEYIRVSPTMCCWEYYPDTKSFSAIGRNDGIYEVSFSLTEILKSGQHACQFMVRA